MITYAVQPAERDAERVRDARADRLGEFQAFAGALKRQRALILCFFVFFGSLSGIVALLIPGKYKSDATVLVQPVGNLADPISMSAQAPPEIVRSQLEVVQSPSVIERVVDKFRLMDDAEFAPSWTLRHGDADTRRAAVISNVTKRLKVDNDGRSVTIHISFEANSPLKAERIADAISSEYIRTAGELKNREVKATRDRLDTRLADLRLETLQAEQAAEDYRRSADLVWLSPTSDGSETGGATTYTSRLLDQFSTQAADISATATQAEAKAQQASGDMARTGGASTPEVLSSPVIASLLQRDAELAENEASMNSRYTSKYPPLVQVRAQRAKLHGILTATRNNIKLSLNMQADSADAADQAANARATALERLVSRQIADGVHYRQLQREAVTKRKIYEDFADKSGTISERSLLQLPDAVLVSPASLPLKESWPNRIVFFIMGCVGTLVLGCAIALLRELRVVGSAHAI